MSRATPQMRAFAKRLLALEAKNPPAAAGKPLVHFRVCEKLRLPLARLMGVGGFRTLLSRAVILASAEVRWLRSVHVKADGTFEGLEEIHAQVTAGEFVEGRVELVAQLLGLLVAFIGESLTLRLAQEVWPGLSLKDLDVGNGDEK